MSFAHPIPRVRRTLRYALLTQFLLNGFVNGSLIALLALGFVVIYQTIRIFHVAYGASFTVAAYLFFVFATQLAIPLPFSAVLAVAISTVLGALIEPCIYSAIHGRRGAHLAGLLSSIGLYTVTVNLIAMIFGSESQVIQAGADSTFAFGSLILAESQLVTLATTVLCLLAAFTLLTRTSLGLAIRAVRDDPELAHAVALDPRNIRIAALGSGSAICAVASILIALDTGMDPFTGMNALLSAAVAMIVGGTSACWGAPLGGLVMGLLQSAVAWQFSGRWVEVITFVLLILLLLVRPRAISGRAMRAGETPL